MMYVGIILSFVTFKKLYIPTIWKSWQNDRSIIKNVEIEFLLSNLKLLFTGHEYITGLGMIIFLSFNNLMER